MLLTEMYNRAPVSQQLFDVSSVHIAYTFCRYQPQFHRLNQLWFDTVFCEITLRV